MLSPKISYRSGRVISAFPRRIQGTKNPSADLITFNSASQSSVNSRPDYQERAGCQRLLFFFFRCCLLATSINLPTLGRLSKSFLTYFPPPKLPIPKERGAENILRQNTRKRFLNFFFSAFHAGKLRRIPPQQRDRKNRDGGQEFGQHPAVRVGG